MAYSTPKTWVSGEYPSTAQMNANLRDNVAFLANPPSCRVYHNATQAVADGGSLLPVLFNTEQYDTNAMHSTVTNTGRITFNTAGLYVVGAFAELAFASDYITTLLSIRLNAAQVIAGSTCGDSDDGTLMNCSTIYKFAVADYIEARVYQNNAGAASRNLGAGIASNGFWATWVGLG